MEEKTDQKPDLIQLDEMNVTDLEAVRALTISLNIKILETVGAEPQTVKQIATALKRVPNSLYYHIKQLEDLNFIKVVSTRVVSGIIEKQYIAAARTYTFSRTLILQSNSNQDAVNEVMNSRILALVDMASNEVKESLQAGLFGPGLLTSMTTSKHRLNQAQVKLFADKFQELINSPEFEDLKGSDGEPAYTYRIAFNLYPLAEAGTNEETQESE